jgi:hypothetical protein
LPGIASALQITGTPGGRRHDRLSRRLLSEAFQLGVVMLPDSRPTPVSTRSRRVADERFAQGLEMIIAGIRGDGSRMVSHGQYRATFDNLPLFVPSLPAPITLTFTSMCARLIDRFTA